MPSFLIIEAGAMSGHRSGRGARGRNLELFLKEYYGSSSVTTIRVEKLSGSRSYQTDHLFIGIPSMVSRNDLKKISFKKIHLFDYGDHEKVIWGNTDKELLVSMTKSYLKPWTQKNWGDEFNWGTLPIRRHKWLSFCFKFHNLVKSSPCKNLERPVDTTFLGNPVVSWQETSGTKNKNIRIQWLEEISKNHQLSFSGGFFMRGANAKRMQEQASKNLKRLFLNKGRAHFVSYFNLMLKAKSVLAPPGNALWSYRHYEAIYAGSIPVSGDFRGADTLIPLPMQGMVHVGKGESVVPHIQRSLQIIKDNPRLTTENLAFIERYMTNGLYDRKKSLLIQRFMSQIERD